MKNLSEIVNSEIKLRPETPLCCRECARNGETVRADYAWPGVAQFPTPYCGRHLNRDKHRLSVSLGMASSH